MKHVISTILIVFIFGGCKFSKKESLEPPKPETRYFLSIDDSKIDLDNISHCGHHFDDDVSDGLDIVHSLINADVKYPVKELVKYYHGQLPHETSKAEKKYQTIFKNILKANNLDHNLDNQLYILEVNFINACILLNRVYVTRALVENANDHQLALILSHEIGHYVNHFDRCYDVINHHYHCIKNPGLASMISSMSSSILNKVLTFSGQADELEADVAGLHICNEAGYDLEEGLSAYQTYLYEHTPTVFFEKFVGDWTRSHPYADDRIRCLDHYIDPAKCEVRSDLLIEINVKSQSVETTEIQAYPHMSSERLDMIPVGEKVFVGYKMFSQHEDWLYVKRLKTNTIGWVKAKSINEMRLKNSKKPK